MSRACATKPRPASSGALAANLREYEMLREFFTSTTLLSLADLPFALLFISMNWSDRRSGRSRAAARGAAVTRRSTRVRLRIAARVGGR
jgi:hypothetical protein